MRISDWSSDVCSSDLRGAALIIAAAGIALGIFVGEDAALRFEYRFRDDILRRDQFDLILLAFEFMLHRRRDRGVDGADAIGEIAGRFDGLVERVCGHRLVSSWGGLESLSTRRVWRLPAKSVVRKASRHALAMSMPVRRSEEHTSELQSLMRNSYAVFWLEKKKE